MEREIARALSRSVTQAAPGDVTTAPPGVTIAIPNWNHELVLPRSIASGLAAVTALARAGVAAEVLVIDDRSRDGSLTLLRQLEALHYADGLRVLAFDRNSGLPVARNAALVHAAYQHVTFMDADNELIPENLPLFYRAARDTAAAAIYGNLIWQEDEGAAGLGSQAALLSNESMQTRIFTENYVDAFALFDRMQVRDAGSYLSAPEVSAREDWELYLHLAVSGRKIVFVPTVFGIYHVLAGSMIQEAAGEHETQKGYIRRVFNQLGLREHLPLNTRHLRYHPDIGYL